MRQLDAKAAPFDADRVEDRDLVLRMLAAEDALLLSRKAADMYTASSYFPQRSFTVERAVQRMVLRQFGFATDPDSVSNYRAIFSRYYTSPSDYDREVMGSVVYMRENRLLYYAAPPVGMGQCVAEQLGACRVNSCGAEDATLTMMEAVRGMGCPTVFVGAFSGS